MSRDSHEEKIFDSAGSSSPFPKQEIEEKKISKNSLDELPSPPDITQKYISNRHQQAFRLPQIFRSGEPRTKKRAEIFVLNPPGPGVRIHDECKPGTSNHGFLGGSNNSVLHEDPILGSPEDQMHDYDHDLDEGGVVEEIIVPPVPEDPTSERHPDLYREDIEFQNHINSVLQKLSEDEKVLMKFNIQKIILDSKFGIGTARSIVNRVEMLETCDEADPSDDSQELNPAEEF